MSTAGAIQGVDYVIMKGAGAAVQVVGQAEMTMTVGGQPVDITNKSSGGFIEYLDAATTSQQVIFSGTIVYNSDADFEAIRAAAFSGTQDDYEIVCGSNGEKYAAKFVPTGLSDAAPTDGNAVMTTISFNSSGVVTRTPQTV